MTTSPPPDTLSFPGAPAPTRVRWLVVAVCVAMSLILYLDRVCVSSAQRYIADELALSGTQMAFFFGVFFWVYALAQVPTGWLSERFGPRLMLTLYIAGWSLFTVLLGLSQGFASLILFRAAMGLTQAGAYPTSGTLISRWIPFENRGLASSAIALGGRVGGAIAPLLTTLCIVSFVSPATPSTLTMTMIKNPAGLADKLRVTEPGKKPVEQSRAAVTARLRQQFTEDDLRQLESTDSTKQQLAVSALNAILTDEVLFDASWLPNLPFEREAWSLARSHPQGDWSPAERQRLNRLTLEAAYPDEFRRIYEQGWRPTMILYGVAGLFVAVAFAFVVRDWPGLHPGCNDSERALIAASALAPPVRSSSHSRGGGNNSSSTAAFPWRAILTSRSLWMMSIMQFGTNVGWVFLITQFPRYLDEVHQVPLAEQGLLQTIPLVVGIVGTLCGGQLTDVLTRRFGLRWGRIGQILATRVLSTAAFALCVVLDDPIHVTIAMSVVAFSVDLGVGPTWAYMQDVGGRNAGTILGWANMWGNFGAAVGPSLIALVLAWSPGNWAVVFSSCALAFALSGVCAFGIDPRRPIVPVEASRTGTDGTP